MSEEYRKIARQIIELIKLVPTKRYREINLLLAGEFGLILVDTKEYLDLQLGIEKSLKLKQIIKKLAFGREDDRCNLTKTENETIKGLIQLKRLLQ